MPGSMRAHHAGFTLLEAVVTLVVVSMLVAMLMQALGQALGLRTRMLRLHGESRAMLLQEAWFREAVGAGQPPGASPGDDVFNGTANDMAYVSATPLVARGSAEVRWSLQPDAGGGVALHYSDPAAPDMVVVPAPLSDATFSYQGTDGQWRTEWRGASVGEVSADMGDAQMLPRLVRFQALTGQGRTLDWIVFLPSDLRASDRVVEEMQRADDGF